MSKEKRSCSAFCRFVGLISIIAIPLSVIYQINWLLGLSITLTVFTCCNQKSFIQHFLVKTVILFRCSFSSEGWVEFGQQLQETRFDGKFAFPNQADTVHILLLLRELKLARPLTQYLRDNKAIWMAKRYINYHEQKKGQTEDRDNQNQTLLEKLFRNYFHFSLQQDIEHKNIYIKWIQDAISVALDYQKSKILVDKNYFIREQKNGQTLQVPTSTYYQVQQYLKKNINRQQNLVKEIVKKQVTQKYQRKSLQLSTHNSSIQNTVIDQMPINWNINCKRGLNNLGNTCYMNSGIQCLHKSFELTKEIKKAKSPSPFIHQYLQLMNELSKDTTSPYSPSKIKKLLSRYNPLFEGYSQQDSCQLLSTLLNYIHDQLNQVKSNDYYNVNRSVERTDEQLLEEYIKKDQSRSKSIIDNIFYGRFLTIYKCLNCDNEQKLFQKFNVIYLPVLNKPKLDLDQCMRQFCKPDQLKGEDAWFCSKCKQDTPTNKTMNLYQANKILIICLKRFTQTSKINSLISFDHQITLSQITNNPKIQNYKYDLYGVINHSGKSLDHGHYYSYCKVGNIWREYNDGYVSQIKENGVISTNAFVLMYRLRE